MIDWSSPTWPMTSGRTSWAARGLVIDRAVDQRCECCFTRRIKMPGGIQLRVGVERGEHLPHAEQEIFR